MVRRVMFLLAMTLCLGALVYSGCSDDKPTNSTLPPGNLNDPNYQWVDSNVFGDGFTGGLEAGMNISFDLFDSIPGVVLSREHPFNRAQAAVGEVLVFDSLSYSYGGGWHVFEFSGYIATTIPLDTVDFNGIDSLRAIKGGVPQQFPDSTIDQLSARAHITMNGRNGSVTRDGDHQLDATRVVDNDSLITLDALMTEAMGFSFSDTASTCDVSVNATMTAAGVIMNTMVEDECPRAGTMSAQVSLSLGCTGSLTVSVDGNWTATATFNGQISTSTVSDGVHTWTEVDTCGAGGPVASRLWR